MAKAFHLSDLAKLADSVNLTSKGSRESDFLKNSVFDLPDYYGVVVEQDSGMTNTDIFATRFSVGDVNDFIGFLTKYPAIKCRQNLCQLLTNFLKEWCRAHIGCCPYEPFLWALKITDNYFGSLQINAVPQPWIVEAIGEALLSVWDESDKNYLKVVSNVLQNWDWYQPIHVMLYIYKEIAEDDDSLDACIRERLLYRALYSNSALECLCRKKRSQNNINSIMRFISQDYQRDMNNPQTEIQITNGMRRIFRSYINDSSEDEIRRAATFYTDSLYNCSRKAREVFSELFDQENTILDDELNDLIGVLKSPSCSDDERRKVQRSLRILFEKEGNAELMIECGVRDPELATFLVDVIEQREFSFSTQFIYKSLVKNARTCSTYNSFIEKKHKETNGIYTNDSSFLYGCAYCCIGHPEILDALFDAFYKNAVGTVNCRFIFVGIQIIFSIQFNEQVNRIAEECRSDVNMALSLIETCSKVYSTKNATLYPVKFDIVCRFLLEYVEKETDGAARYASVLLDLYERITCVSNRNRYYNDLMTICQTRSSALSKSRSRAQKIITCVYGAV